MKAIHPTNENANSALSEAVSITCLKVMEVETKGYKGIYDGKSHKIDVYAPEGATVTYYDSELDEYTSTNLGKTAAGVYEIHYKVTKPGYVTVEGYETIEIQPKSIEDMKVIVEEDIKEVYKIISNIVDDEVRKCVENAVKIGGKSVLAQTICFNKEKDVYIKKVLNR